MIVVYETAAAAQNALAKNGDDFGPYLLDELIPTMGYKYEQRGYDDNWKYEKGTPHDERFKPGKTKMTTQEKGVFFWN